MLVAKQATDVSLLSNGRFNLGVGTGWNHVKYDALGQDFSTRGARLDEQIPLLRRLWSEPVVSFEGSFDRVDHAALLPRPAHPIPIYCGGGSDQAYRRAARLADGFIFAGTMAAAVRGLARLRTFLADAGRETHPFRFHLLLQTSAYGGLSVDGTPEALRIWSAHGGTHASVVSMGMGFAELEQHLEHFTTLRRLFDRR